MRFASFDGTSPRPAVTLTLAAVMVLSLLALPVAAQTTPPSSWFSPDLPIIVPPSTTTSLTALNRTSVIRTNEGFNAYEVPRNDDESGPLVPIGFEINFFGRLRSSLYVNNNGNVTLDAPLSTYTPFGLTSTQREIIAAFFADVDTRPSGSNLVTYGYDTIDGRRAFGANFIDVGYYNQHDDKLNSFQLILIDRSDTGAGNFDIEFNYDNVSWETGDASGGSGGFGGTPAAVGWSNGSGQAGTSYELDGSLISGALLNSGSRALIKRRVNSQLFGRYVFRARNGEISPGLTITTSSDLPSATVDEAYSTTFEATGANEPYHWSLVLDPGASLPGLSLSQAGVLEGTPTETAMYEFTVKAESDTPDGVETDSKRVRLEVSTKLPSISGFACPLPAGTAGSPYSYKLQSTAGSSPSAWTWASASDSTPVPGLTLAEDGSISGTPPNAGTFVFNLVLTSSDAAVDPLTKNCSLTVDPAPAVVTFDACPAQVSTFGVPYSDAIKVSGGAPPYYWQVNGMLPSGLSLDPSGVLSGTPQTPGWYEFQFVGMDSRGQMVTQHCNMQVRDQELSILTACPLPTASSSKTYLATLQAEGGTGEYAWRVEGSLPAGLSLWSEGVIFGRTYRPGPASFQLIVQDSEGRAASRPCSMSVESDQLTITSCPLLPATVDQYYVRPLNAVDGTQPFIWSGAALPTGMVVSSTGSLKGTPTMPGDYDITLKVRDVTGKTSTATCTFQVLPEVVRITSACPLPEASLGVPYRATLTARGGFGDYVWNATGDLTQGLSLGPDGVLSGTPTSSGESGFTLVVRDSHGNANAAQCTLRAKLPGEPLFELTGMEDPLPAASGLRPLHLQLAKPYPLELRGTLALEVDAETGSETGEVNFSDPAVRFLDGSRLLPFTIPAGQTEFLATLATSGTVASRIALTLKEPTAAGTAVPNTAGALVSHVERETPVLTGACFVPGSGSIDLRLTGYTTTRSLLTAEVQLGTSSDARQVSADLDYYASEFFSSDLSIRSGGAFDLTIPVTLPARMEAPSTMVVNVTNEVGASESRQASRCQ